MRTIALKAVGNRSCQHSGDDSEEESLSLLSKKFSKFLKKNNNKSHTNDRYVSKKNNRLKGLNNWLENTGKAPEEELENSKIDFENLELIYKKFFLQVQL